MVIFTHGSNRHPHNVKSSIIKCCLLLGMLIRSNVVANNTIASSSGSRQAVPVAKLNINAASLEQLMSI